MDVRKYHILIISTSEFIRTLLSFRRFPHVSQNGTKFQSSFYCCSKYFSHGRLEFFVDVAMIQFLCAETLCEMMSLLDKVDDG